MKKKEFPMLYLLVCESNLDDIVKSLQSMKNDTTNYFYDFLGHRLYSDTVTLDGAYEKIYKMSRQEYREKLQESYGTYRTKEKEKLENIRKEVLEKKSRIYEQAKKVILEDQMHLFDEVLGVLMPHGIYFSSEENIQLFLELLEQLNSDNYSLAVAKELYNKIQSNYILANCCLLKAIKQLSVHGSALFDELYDEESELRAKQAQERMATRIQQMQVQSSAFEFNRNFGEPSSDEILTNYDRKITTRCLIGYSFKKNKH